MLRGKWPLGALWSSFNAHLDPKYTVGNDIPGPEAIQPPPGSLLRDVSATPFGANGRL